MFCGTGPRTHCLAWDLVVKRVAFVHLQEIIGAIIIYFSDRQYYVGRLQIDKTGKIVVIYLEEMRSKFILLAPPPICPALDA